MMVNSDDYVFYARHDGKGKLGPYSNQGDAWKAVLGENGAPLPGAQVWPMQRGVYHEDGRPTRLARTVDERLDSALDSLHKIGLEVEQANLPPDARPFQERIVEMIAKALGDAA